VEQRQKELTLINRLPFNASGFQLFTRCHKMCVSRNASQTKTPHVTIASINDTTAGTRRAHAIAAKTIATIATVAQIQILTELA
jgi:hypothetical protein